MKKRILSLFAAAVMLLSFPVTVSAQNSKASTQDQKDYLSYVQFRGSTFAQGLVDSKTPISPDQTVEKWAASFGTGWSSTPGTPIVVGDYLYVVVPGQSRLCRVSLETGEVLKYVDCSGSSQFFSTIAYHQGVILVPRAKQVNKKNVAVLYAYDEQTMEKLWETAPIGDVDAQLQPLSAVVGNDGYVYTGVSNGNAQQGAYVCFDLTDEDPSRTDEQKQATWSYTPESPMKSGYYWSGGAIVGNAIVFGGEATELVSHDLTTGEVYDRIVLESNPSAGIRSTVHYDAQTNRIYVATKGGNIYSIKIGADHKFDRSSLITKKIGSDITSSPVVFKGRLYIGGGGISSNTGFTVMDANTLEIIYQINDVKTQASPIISTAYATEENNWEVQIYVTKYAGYENGDYSDYAKDSSCIYQITDRQGQTTPTYQTLITPSLRNYCTQSVAIDADGTMYYYNDTGKMFAMGHKNASMGAFTAQDIENSIKLAQSNGAIALRDEFTLNRIRVRYESLSAQEQAKVLNLADFNQMLSQLHALKNEETVIGFLNEELAKIDFSNITLAQDTVIQSLLSNYQSLSEAGKERIALTDQLIQAANTIQNLKDQQLIFQINERISRLPSLSDLCYDNKTEVEAVALLAGSQSLSVQSQLNWSALKDAQKRIQEISDLIQKINQMIFNDLDPMNITIKDRDTIDTIVSDYSKLSAKDQKYIRNFDDVLYAQKVIAGLTKDQTIISEVFQNLVGSDKDYTIEQKTSQGNSYTMTFNGMDIKDPMLAFKIGLSLTSNHAAAIKGLASDAMILSFAHTGALPGKATVTIDVDLEDGVYSLYYFNPENKTATAMQTVTVQNGKVRFSIDHCSDYFISSKTEVVLEENSNAESNQQPSSSGSVPETGDDNNVWWMLLIAIGSAALLAVLLVAVQKKSNDNK